MKRLLWDEFLVKSMKKCEKIEKLVTSERIRDNNSEDITTAFWCRTRYSKIRPELTFGVVKCYLCQKMITSENVVFEAQQSYISFISWKSYVMFSIFYF